MYFFWEDTVEDFPFLCLFFSAHYADLGMSFLGNKLLRLRWWGESKICPSFLGRKINVEVGNATSTSNWSTISTNDSDLDLDTLRNWYHVTVTGETT
jgi:hypothetical protein